MRRLLTGLILSAATLIAIPCFADPSATAKPAVTAAKPFSVTVTGKGRPMILIPGLACSGDVWKDVVDHYKDRYECHVFTLAGFAGQAPLGDTTTFLPVMRDAVIAYAKEHKLDRPIIVGHSLGGILSYDLVSTEPALFGAAISVDGYPYLPATMNPSATPETMAPMVTQLRTMLATMTHDQFVAQNKATLGSMAKPGPRVAEAEKWGASSDQPTVAQAMADVMNTDLRAKLAAAKSPILLIAAGDYAKGPMRAQLEQSLEGQLAKAPNHHLVLADNARHFIMFDDLPFLLTTMDAFLKEKVSP